MFWSHSGSMRLLNSTFDLCSLISVLYLTLITHSVSFDCGERLFLTLHSATLMIFALVQTGGAGVKLCTSLWHINNWTALLGRTIFEDCDFCFVFLSFNTGFIQWLQFNCTDPLTLQKGKLFTFSYINTIVTCNIHKIHDFRKNHITVHLLFILIG